MPVLRTRDAFSRTEDGIVSPAPLSADSPYQSPDDSPLEADLCAFPTASSSTPPPSEPAPGRSTSPTPSGIHKRRKSSCSSDVDRRPKKGDEDYIKRPENAFILFRRKCCEDRQQAQDEAAAGPDGPAKKQRQADLSKTISQQWKSLAAEERQYWEQLAKDKKKEHEQLYPNYVYRPQRTKEKSGKLKKTRKQELEDGAGSLSFIVPAPRPHGRSSSAPSAAPYQSFQVPNVYHLNPSCPTSPSLLPMISRRAAHPSHTPVDPLASFDYLPSANYPTSFPMAYSSHDAQSSEFLRSMLAPPAPMPSSRPSNGLSPLQQIAENFAIGSSGSASGSSGPSSPLSAPYTPISAIPAHSSYPPLSCSSDTTVSSQAQAELDLQMELQMQHEFASFSWGNPASLWSLDPPELLTSDFDLSSIPPIELGGKFASLAMEASNTPSGLDFGDYGSHHGGLLFDEMMAGHGF